MENRFKNFANSNNIDITQIQSKLKTLGLIRNQDLQKIG